MQYKLRAYMTGKEMLVKLCEVLDNGKCPTDNPGTEHLIEMVPWTDNTLLPIDFHGVAFNEVFWGANNTESIAWRKKCLPDNL